MSIKIKLTLTTILVFMFMVVLIGFIFFSAMRESLETSAEQQAQHLCNDAVFSMEKSILAETNIVRSIASRDRLVSEQRTVKEKIEGLQNNIEIYGYEYIILNINGESYKIAADDFYSEKPEIEYPEGETAFYGKLFHNEEQGLFISYPISDNSSILAKRQRELFWQDIFSSNDEIIFSKHDGEIVYPYNLAGSIAKFNINTKEDVSFTRISGEDKNGQDSYAISVLSDEIPLYVTSYINLHDVNEQLTNYILLYVILALSSIIIIAVISYLFSYLMTKSINDLSEYAKHSQIKINNVPERFLKRHDEAGALSRSFSSLMNKLISTLKKNEYMAFHDSLTGLFNRYKMEQDITNLFLKQSAFAFALLDIDDFKTINDSYGHAEGDLVLANLASILQRVSSDNFEIYRWGGDEFALIIFGNSNEEHKTILDNIMKEISASLKQYEGKSITISIGVCQYPDCANTYKSLLIAADKALTESKFEGKNRYTFYDKE